VVAGVAAFVAQRFVAPLAVVAVVGVRGRTTVVARLAVPVVHFHVGTAPGVGEQGLAHKQKEVAKPALVQGGPDCRAAFTFAEPLVLNVRVRDFAAGGGRLGVQTRVSVTL